MSEQVFHFFPCRGNMSCWLCTPHGCDKRDGCPDVRNRQPLTVAQLIAALHAQDPTGQKTVDVIVRDAEDPDGGTVLCGEPSHWDTKNGGDSADCIRLRFWLHRD